MKLRWRKQWFQRQKICVNKTWRNTNFVNKYFQPCVIIQYFPYSSWNSIKAWRHYSVQSYVIIFNVKWNWNFSNKNILPAANGVQHVVDEPCRHWACHVCLWHPNRLAGWCHHHHHHLVNNDNFYSKKVFFKQ